MGFAFTLIYLGLDVGYLACGFGVRRLARRTSLSRARRMVFLSATGLLCVSALVTFMPDTNEQCRRAGGGQLRYWNLDRYVSDDGAGGVDAKRVDGDRHRWQAALAMWAFAGMPVTAESRR